MKLLSEFEEKVEISVRQIFQSIEKNKMSIRIFSILFFLIGLFVAILNVDLNYQNLAISPLIIITIFFVPLTLIIAALSLQVSAKVLSVKVGFVHGLVVSAVASLAELLPVPGGAMVRSSTLINSGAHAGESAVVTTLGAVLMLALAVILGSFSLLSSHVLVGCLFLLAGIVLCIIIIVYLVHKSSLKYAIIMMVVRVASIVVSSIRLIGCFAAMGATITFSDSMLFVVSTTVGSAITIVPAGLGVSEGLAAGLAILVSVPPEAAFIAVALNRILGLLVSGAFWFGSSRMNKWTKRS